jgi:hypothetical protein
MNASADLPHFQRRREAQKRLAICITEMYLLILEMTDWACTVKHRAFSEEKEWRIMTYLKGATLVGVKPPDYEGVSVQQQGSCFHI